MFDTIDLFIRHFVSDHLILIIIAMMVSRLVVKQIYAEE